MNDFFLFIAGLLLTHLCMYLIGYLHGKRGQKLV
jgi:hypothetical protein